MNHIEQLRSTLTDLESRLSKAGIDDTDTYHAINNSRIAIDELEKMVIIDGIIIENAVNDVCPNCDADDYSTYTLYDMTRRTCCQSKV